MSETQQSIENPQFLGVDMVRTAHGFILQWRAKGIGFGELTFYRDRTRQRWEVATEHMGAEFAAKALAAWAKLAVVVE